MPISIEVSGPGELEAHSGVSPDGILVLNPIFYGSGREPSTAFIVQVKSSDGEVVHVYTARISGDTLKVTLSDRTKPVVPCYLRKKAKERRNEQQSSG